MPRSRPASKPISFHKATGQYYITRGGKRVYLGTDDAEALARYHQIEMGLERPKPQRMAGPLTAKALANRFIATQRANWRDPEGTTKCYLDWLGRFLRDHPRLLAADLTVETFAAWKLSLKRRGYAPESINHYLGAVRAMYTFAEDTELIPSAPKLRRVKNEPPARATKKALYTPDDVAALLTAADEQRRVMVLLAINCGFGPKDLQDLCWSNLADTRVTLPRSKTGVSQTYALWPETRDAVKKLKKSRHALIERLARRERFRTDAGHVFMTKYWRPWSKDAIAGEFRKLCKAAGVTCHGFYRLRHCASTAMSLVASPHVHRKFMRHAQLQQQVTYTHTPDDEVDAAVLRAREKLLPTAGLERNQGQVEAS